MPANVGLDGVDRMKWRARNKERLASVRSARVWSRVRPILGRGDGVRECAARHRQGSVGLRKAGRINVLYRGICIIT